LFHLQVKRTDKEYLNPVELAQRLGQKQRRPATVQFTDCGDGQAVESPPLAKRKMV
jgi:hypothetical protein